MTENRSTITGIASIKFSETNYWIDNNNNIKSKYGSNYPADILDQDYNSESGSNYSIYYYINKYNYLLKSMNLKTTKARLLTLQELISLGCTKNVDLKYNCSNAPGFIYYPNTYWIGTAIDNIYIKYTRMIKQLKPKHI